MDDVAALLRKRGVQPSAQRVAVAKYALTTHDHPSADEVWERVRRTLPTISRATVYNTLNLFADKGLMSRHVIVEGCVVFDSVVELYYHFIDEATGRIHDVPWDAIRVEGVGDLPGFDVRAHQVVMRGRRTARSKGR